MYPSLNNENNALVTKKGSRFIDHKLILVYIFALFQEYLKNI